MHSWHNLDEVSSFYTEDCNVKFNNPDIQIDHKSSMSACSRMLVASPLSRSVVHHRCRRRLRQYYRHL
jgi:hypothetical protein